MAILSNGSLLGSGGAITNFVHVDDNSDLALRGNVARSTYGVTGSGIKIGILSDSFNVLGGAATDIANGDLPASGVTVQREGGGSTDEGRAMAELIHRIAPDAQLYFATAGFNAVTFAGDIEELQAAGCQIIVDDVAYLNEPFFQDGGVDGGIIQNAVHTVASQGVSYFTAAGNEGRQFYEAAFNPISVTAGGATFLDQDFGGGLTRQSITIPTGATAVFVMQWDEGFGQANNDFQIRLQSNNGIVVDGDELILNQNPFDPVIAIEYFNNTPSTNFTLSIDIDRGEGVNTSPIPSLIKYISFSSPGVTINDPNANIGSGTVFGHALNMDANTVGAVDWASTPAFGTNPPVIEPFSSVGPGEILLDANGNPLALPLIANKVDFSAPDGSSTSVFNPFFGTSAAAPDAAAVAALMLQANPALTHTDITALLKDSALDMGVPGFDNATGAGLIQADKAVGYVVSGTITAFSGGPNILYGTHLGNVITGSGNDTIVVGGGNNTLDGGSGVNTLDYSQAPGSVTLNLATDSAANGFGGIDAFSNFQIFKGSASNDTFLAGSGNHTLDGGGGTNTLDYSVAPTAVTVSLATGLASNGYGGTDTFTNFQRVVASAFNDLLTGGAGNDVLAGGAGNNTLDGGSGVNTADYSAAPGAVAVDLATGSASNGYGGIDSLTNIQAVKGSTHGGSLTGGAGNDTFVIEGGNNASSGGGGINTVDYSDATGAVSVDLATGSASNGFGGTDSLAGIQTIKGSTHGGALTGGSGNDTFVIEGGNNSLNGGSGTNIADYSAAPGTVTVNLATRTVSNGFGGSDTLQNIQGVIGSASDDIFTGAAGNHTIYGGGGTNTLDYSAASGAVTANLATGAVTNGFGGADQISNIQIIKSGAGNDTFVGGSGNHIFDGGGGTNTLDYSVAPDAVQVNLTPGVLFTGYGAASNGFGGVDKLTNVQKVIGSAFDDSLFGAPSGTTVLVGGAGNNNLQAGFSPGLTIADYSAAPNAVTVTCSQLSTTVTNGYGGTDRLANITAINGSAHDDTFVGGFGNYAFDGGGGVDMVDYSDLTGPVSVDLATGTASKGGNGGTDTLANIENVTGSAFNDVITGTAGLNFLTGGAGNDTFIFAASNLSADTVNGGSGDNTLELATGTGIGTLTGLGSPSFANLGVINVDAGANWLFSSTQAVIDMINLAVGAVAEFSGTVGAGHTIDFTASTGTLKIDSATQFAGLIAGFQTGDTIDLTGVAFDSSGSASLGAGNVLRVGENSQIYDFNFDPTQNFAGKLFNLTSDGSGGTDITQVTSLPNPPPPAGTTADMILRNGFSGFCEIFDIGNNAMGVAHSLGQVGTDYKFAGLGNFSGSDTTDMMLRSSTSGAFEVYDISNNSITGAASLGAVGVDWTVAGFGDFNHDGTSDMMLRNADSGSFEAYSINNNHIISASNIGAVGLDWQIAGFGDFNHDGTTDMMLRNASSGTFEAYAMRNSQLSSASNIGAVGLDWQVAGFGDFNGDGTSDMMLRNATSGMFELYDINNNSIAGASAIGAVGLDWEVAGFGPISGAGASDMVLRNSGTGAFEVYDISNNQLTTAASLGAVGLDWQVGGIAAVGSSAHPMSSITQLVQAMASFSSGGAAIDQGPIGATAHDETSQPSLFAAASLQHSV